MALPPSPPNNFIPHLPQNRIDVARDYLLLYFMLLRCYINFMQLS
jgi:hypothetical protein